MQNNGWRIHEKGLKRGPDGCVYLAETMNDSAKFLLIRGAKVPDLLFVEIDAACLDKEKLNYSNDHSVSFFGCEAFSYDADIPARFCRGHMFTATEAAHGIL
jgi:hypothetical protein